MLHALSSLFFTMCYLKANIFKNQRNVMSNDHLIDIQFSIFNSLSIEIYLIQMIDVSNIILVCQWQFTQSIHNLNLLKANNQFVIEVIIIKQQFFQAFLFSFVTLFSFNCSTISYFYIIFMGNIKTTSKDKRQISTFEDQVITNDQNKGILTIFGHNTKNNRQQFVLCFKSCQTESLKIVKWKRASFQISQSSQDLSSNYTQVQKIGEFSEQQIIDAIKWASVGAFSTKKSSGSSQWCESICWKLGKKVTLRNVTLNQNQ